MKNEYTTDTSDKLKNSHEALFSHRHAYRLLGICCLTVYKKDQEKGDMFDPTQLYGQGLLRAETCACMLRVT